MKITSILFWGGMVTTIMLFALFLGLICQDIIYKRVHNGVKYFFIIPIGILCVMFFLLSTLVAGTDILSYFYQTKSEKEMDITIYLYHNNRIFYDMDIPANSSICNECDNRTYIKFIDIVMWTLRRDALYARKKTMDIRIKDRPLGGDAIAF